MATDKAPPSNEGDKKVLIPVDVVVKKYGHLIRNGASEGNVRMLILKLAKEAIFGEQVMTRCTPGGTRELHVPGLPVKELYELKK